MEQKIKHFTDLDVWKESHNLILDIYKATQSFPALEQFGLISQLRRASVSVTSNIAEGFSRYHYSDRARFYYMARGSLSEVQNQVLIAKDLGYLKEEPYQDLWKKTEHIAIILNGLIQMTCKLSES